MNTARQILLACLVAVALTVVFWQPLWAGGGLIGGDIYAYFFPQKAFYAEQLREGSLPLWNNRIGWGYPLLAESQTGVFYPLHLLLYGLLDLNTAYNASLIVHYGLAFLFAWLYARGLGQSVSAALLAALVYVYGWFPARVSLEWAIVGGAWLPLVLWLAERFLRTRHWRYPIWLALVLAGQMLAGHFTLAFVTQVTLAAYVALRLSLAQHDLPNETRAHSIACGFAVAAAFVGAFALAAVQLLPTWELKQQSQRHEVSAEHDPAYGYLPWKYVAQAVAPWYWYADEQAFNRAMTPGGPRTNRVEAHLYFGLIPLALAAGALWQQRRQGDRRLWTWLILGLLALLHATGVFVPLTGHLPGFSFFEGLGRFGIITTLAVGLFAGAGFDSLLQSVARSGRRPAMRGLLQGGTLGLVLALTTADLWIVSRPGVLRWLVYGVPELAEAGWDAVSRELVVSVVVRSPVIDRLADSPVRQRLAEEPQPVRLFSEAKNLPSLLGVSTMPVYLGLGPRAYFEPGMMYPGALDFASPPAAKQVAWMKKAGVSHLLSFVPLEPSGWPARRIWSGSDSFLNAALARHPQEPLYLYRLERTRPRLSWLEPLASTHAELRIYRPTYARAEVSSAEGGTIVLADLDYPGWQATVDGASDEMLAVDDIFRGVRVSAGEHAVVWKYRPTSLYWGIGVSLGALVCVLALGHIRYWHPQWFARRAARVSRASMTRT